MHAADGLAHIVIRGSGDGASVQDDDVGRSAAIDNIQAMRGKVRLDCGAVRLRGAAPEVLDVERIRQPSIIAL